MNGHYLLQSKLVRGNVVDSFAATTVIEIASEGILASAAFCLN